jgi:hypothetical protein
MYIYSLERFFGQFFNNGLENFGGPAEVGVQLGTAQISVEVFTKVSSF